MNRHGILRRLMTIDGPVEYLVAGQGAPLVAFHGALGNAESMAWFVRAFADDFRVIVPSVGDRWDPATVVRSVECVLDAEGVQNAAVFGISFGGLVAQAFLERRPQRVSRLILMSCPPLRRAASLLYHAASSLARRLPLSLLQLLVRGFLSRRLAPAPRGTAVQRALRTHRRRLDRLGDRLDRKAVVSRFALAARIHEGAIELRRVLRLWSGPVLLMVADDDPLLGGHARERLREEFPWAYVHAFAMGGHVIPLFHGEEVRRVIGAFARDGIGSNQATASRFRSPLATRYSSSRRAKIASQR